MEEKIELEKTEEKKIFAKGYCFTKIFIFFLIGCLFGTYYEEILCFISKREWVNRQGLIFGPFSPIYGFGVSIYIALLGKHNEKRSILKTYLYSCLIGGVAEFMTSIIGEFAFGVKFWDYTGYFLNILGRTTIPFMLAWGLLGLFLMKVAYPLVSKLVEKIPYKYGEPIYIIVLIFIILDMILTYSALGRMALRDNGKEPLTFVGRIYDKIYTDEYLYNKFPAMRPDK